MRFVIPVAALTLFAVPALAQQTTTTPAAPAPATSTPAAPATTAPATTTPAAPAAPSASATPAAPKKKHMVSHHRRTLQEHFDAANTTHDGHLTKDQATAAKWSYVTRHFTAMDTEKKGYVTVEDIHNYAKAQHMAHKKAAKTPAAPAAEPSTKG